LIGQPIGAEATYGRTMAGLTFMAHTRLPFRARSKVTNSPGAQISSTGNVATMDEELSAGYVINDESVASRAIIKFHLASRATPDINWP
jgi:hypothetical protein